MTGTLVRLREPAAAPAEASLYRPTQMLLALSVTAVSRGAVSIQRRIPDVRAMGVWRRADGAATSENEPNPFSAWATGLCIGHRERAARRARRRAVADAAPVVCR